VTHDELLAKLSNDENGYAGSTPLQRVRALRAVVELHKPFEEDGKILCSQEECYYHLEFMDRDNCSCVYPCPTIQVIEKELG
jgi:hypothetical protein